MPPHYPQRTLRFKTYLKRAIVQGIRSAFYNHPDKLLKDTQASIEFPTDQVQFPYVLVKFYERSIDNAGVGHVEWLQNKTTKKYHQFGHYLYKGDLEFQVYAQTSLDRDYVSDTLVEILAMGKLQDYSNFFFQRIYDADPNEDFEVANENFITLNTDRILPFGENQGQAPWGAEDQLIYQSAYRVGLLGEIYNRIDPANVGTGVIERVDVYPYRNPFDPEPEPNPHPDDPAPWS